MQITLKGIMVKDTLVINCLLPFLFYKTYIYKDVIFNKIHSQQFFNTLSEPKVQKP